MLGKENYIVFSRESGGQDPNLFVCTEASTMGFDSVADDSRLVSCFAKPGEGTEELLKCSRWLSGMLFSPLLSYDSIRSALMAQ